MSLLSPAFETMLGAAAMWDASAMETGAWLGRSVPPPACAHCDAKEAAVFSAGLEAGRKLPSSTGDAASRAGGVTGEPLLLPPLPLPPQLGLLLLRALRLKEGSCAWAVR